MLARRASPSASGRTAASTRADLQGRGAGRRDRGVAVRLEGLDSLARRRRRRPGRRRLGLRRLAATARSPPTRTWSPPARATRSSARDQVYVEFADGNQVRGEDRRPRPERRHRAAEGRPEGPDAAAAAARPSDSEVQVGDAGGGDRLAVRREAVAVGRRRVRRRPRDRLADRVPDLRRDPDRRRDQPRQLRRPAGRRARPRDRRQPADQVAAPAAARASASRCRSTVVQRSLDGLRDDGEVHYAYLGVQSVELYPQLVDRFNLAGRQGRVGAGRCSPAARAQKAGLQRRQRATSASRRGRSATAATSSRKIDGRKVDTPDDLSEAIAAVRPGPEGHGRGLPRRQEARPRRSSSASGRSNPPRNSDRMRGIAADLAHALREIVAPRLGVGGRPRARAGGRSPGT